MHRAALRSLLLSCASAVALVGCLGGGGGPGPATGAPTGRIDLARTNGPTGLRVVGEAQWDDGAPFDEGVFPASGCISTTAATPAGGSGTSTGSEQVQIDGPLGTMPLSHTGSPGYMAYYGTATLAFFTAQTEYHVSGSGDAGSFDAIFSTPSLMNVTSPPLGGATFDVVHDAALPIAWTSSGGNADPVHVLLYEGITGTAGFTHFAVLRCTFPDSGTAVLTTSDMRVFIADTSAVASPGLFEVFKQRESVFATSTGRITKIDAAVKFSKLVDRFD